MAVCAPAWSVVVIDGMELQSASPTQATLTLSLDGSTRTRVFRLDGPDRVVIDLPDTRLDGKLRLPAGAGPVAVVRSGVQPGALRLVIETQGVLQAQTHWTGSAGTGFRLTVDLAPPGAAAPAPTPVLPKPSAPTLSASAEPASPPVAVRSVRAAGDGRDIIVAIDAGHGGQDPGAIGRSGTREKDVVLGIAMALARRIDAEPGMKAVLTRGTDKFIPLRDRMSIARNGRADIFVSIHADSIVNRDVSGSSVYVLSDRGATSEAARWLAERENAADLKGGVSLSDKQGQLASVLMDLSQTASIGSSMEAAERVLTYMDRVGEVRKSRVQQAGFVVLKSPDIPSMLVETAYISNPAEEKRLRTPQHQERIASAIFSGVREYFRASPPDGTLFAQQRSRGGAAPIMAVNAGP
ncbi:MAG: N-acetylmuramoyl-L-alanine amidase [Steroidobacteraceae bacterium]